jgi:hypothetical protein
MLQVKYLREGHVLRLPVDFARLPTWSVKEEQQTRELRHWSVPGCLFSLGPAKSHASALLFCSIFCLCNNSTKNSSRIRLVGRDNDEVDTELTCLLLRGIAPNHMYIPARIFSAFPIPLTI